MKDLSDCGSYCISIQIKRKMDKEDQLLNETTTGEKKRRIVKYQTVKYKAIGLYIYKQD